MLLLAFLAPCAIVFRVAAFDNDRYDNVAVYWGQNSYGAGHSDPANFQKALSFYCQDDAINVFPIAFLHVFFGAGGLPSINLANTCNTGDNGTFPGTELPNCAALAPDIKVCQSKGKVITLSLGGATGAVGFQSDNQAIGFAQTLWDLFLGGSSSTRPFGTAVLDGIDLDIEGGSSAGYTAFVNRIRSLSGAASKKYYVTAAPQCPFPDSAMGGVLNTAHFDVVYVQFYNNYCSLVNFNQAQNWNFGIWDNWARETSPNKHVKVYIGAPASPSAAGSGYVGIGTLKNIAVQMRKSFPSFGGVMLWDASQAFANGRYDKDIKNALVAAGGTGFTYPPCSAPAFVAGTNYPANSKVSFGGYIWQAKWFASAQPASNPNGEWSAISACGGKVKPQSSLSRMTATTPTTLTTSGTATNSKSTTSPTSTSTSPPMTPTPGGNCADVTTDVLGGTGAWTNNGPCSTQKLTKKGSLIPQAISTSLNSRFFRF